MPLYGKVRYTSVYPGIDLVYYGNGTHLEYDFVLWPGADPSRIRIRFRGTDRVALTPDGDLALDAAGARLMQRRPLVYQQDASGARHEIAARYRMVDSRTAAVEVARYDRSRALTIDPVLEYASLFGGAAGDGITCMTIDKEGFIWAAGTISDVSMDVRGNFFSNVFSGGNTDIFIVRVDPHGSGRDSMAYLGYVGGDGNDSPSGIYVDDSLNVYLTGNTSSGNFPLAGVSYQTTLNNSSDATVLLTDVFALKLRTDIAGSDALVWSTYLGGTGVDEARGLGVDAAGKVYVTGMTKSTDFPVTGSAYQSTMWGPQDAFIARFDPDAGDGPSSLVYSTFLGGEGFDDGRSIVVAPNGDVYAAGSTSSTQFPWNGAAYQGSIQGGSDIWVARIDASQAGTDSIPYASYFGGSGVDEVRSMVVDASGKLWLTGVTLSTDYPVTGNAYQGTAPGDGGDVFITCLDFSPDRPAFVAYSTYLGGSRRRSRLWHRHRFQGARVGDRLYAFERLPGDQGRRAGRLSGRHRRVRHRPRHHQDGRRRAVYSTYLGQINTQVGYALAVGPDGTVAVGGSTARAGIQATDNAAAVDYAGGATDAFLAVFAP